MKAEGAIGKSYMSHTELKQWVAAAKAKATAAKGVGASNKMIITSSSVSTPVVEDQLGDFTADNLGVQQPPTLPDLDTDAPPWEPPQLRGYEVASPPRFGIDDFFGFERDSGSGLRGHPMSHGGVDYGAGAEANFGNFTFEDSIGGFFFPRSAIASWHAAIESPWRRDRPPKTVRRRVLLLYSAADVVSTGFSPELWHYPWSEAQRENQD